MTGVGVDKCYGFPYSAIRVLHITYSLYVALLRPYRRTATFAYTYTRSNFSR